MDTAGIHVGSGDLAGSTGCRHTPATASSGGCASRGEAYGWWWMRRRLLRREPSRETHQRLLGAEVTAMVAAVALEASQLLWHGPRPAGRA